MRHIISHIALVLLLCVAGTQCGFAEEAKEEKKKDNLHDLMEAIGDDYKAVYKIIKKKAADKKADAIKALDSLKKNCVKSKALIPHKADGIKDEAAKKKFVDSYKKEMDVLIANIDKLKKAVEGDDWDGGLKIIKAMKTHKGDSHDKFQDEE